jgi:hypothetical protein
MSTVLDLRSPSSIHHQCSLVATPSDTTAFTIEHESRRLYEMLSELIEFPQVSHDLAIVDGKLVVNLVISKPQTSLSDSTGDYNAYSANHDFANLVTLRYGTSIQVQDTQVKEESVDRSDAVSIWEVKKEEPLGTSLNVVHHAEEEYSVMMSDKTEDELIQMFQTQSGRELFRVSVFR